MLITWEGKTSLLPVDLLYIEGNSTYELRILEITVSTELFAYTFQAVITSFCRLGSPGLVIRAVPLTTTAVSSTKTQSGRASSGGSSITSRPNLLKVLQYAACCSLARLRLKPLVALPFFWKESGKRHTMAWVNLKALAIALLNQRFFSKIVIIFPQPKQHGR